MLPTGRGAAEHSILLMHGVGGTCCTVKLAQRCTGAVRNGAVKVAQFVTVLPTVADGDRVQRIYTKWQLLAGKALVVETVKEEEVAVTVKPAGTPLLKFWSLTDTSPAPAMVTPAGKLSEIE